MSNAEIPKVMHHSDKEMIDTDFIPSVDKVFNPLLGVAKCHSMVTTALFVVPRTC